MSTPEAERSNNDVALDLFHTSVKFTGERYAVGLPWRPSRPELLSNLDRAQGRLDRLNRKLSSNLQLSTAYESAIKEFVDSGYVEEAQPCSSTEFYLPHRPVVKDSPSTYRVRPVLMPVLRTDRASR